MNAKKLVRKVLPKSAIKAAEETYRKGRIKAAHARYGQPAKGLRVIGVTGTNGKTTTCNYINEMLKSAGYTTGMLTTAVNELAGVQTLNRKHRTVPLTADLLNFLQQSKQKKVDFVVLEITSHALDQHKVRGIPIEVAVMTNLTQDHLDYHGTMEAYAAAKARLFNDYMQPKICILNADDEWFGYYRGQSVGTVMSYGKAASAHGRLQQIESTAIGNTAHLVTKEATVKLTSPLVGEFNLYNATAAAMVGLALGIKPVVVQKGVAALKAVPGRMESISEGQPYGVVVDYAHAPDALENVLKSLKAVTKGRVIAVFGATGDRDTTKRPLMGEAAAKYADWIFLTDDETYTEAAAPIRAAVMEGILKAGGKDKTTEVPDRLEAIESAFRSAKKGDVVVLAGLGHQDYRMMNDGKLPWDERDVARRVLKTLA